MSDFEREVSETSRAWMRALGNFTPTVNPLYREVKGSMLGEYGEAEKTYFDSKELRELAKACAEVADWLDRRAAETNTAQQKEG
ncbi:hypothetical protein ACIGFL_09375 [Pseudomonas sp. NPDC077649]|uniref:hypothetical protein n=1 Tax=Pseudomonas sp. NPDC077649 TaxID=3364423 RepID=UPI0037C6DEBE